MAKGYLSEFKVSHYRGFNELTVAGLTLVNLIGGANGIGKSSLLEALFHLVDRANPITLFRPYQFRQIPLAPADNINAVQQVFHKRDLSNSICISASTKQGDVSLEYKFGRQNITNNVAQSVQQGDINKPTTETAYTATGEGIRITSQIGKRKDFDAIVQFSDVGAIVNIVVNEIRENPAAVILTPTNRGSDGGIPGRYSNLVRSGIDAELTAFLHLVHPEIKGLNLLSFGGGTILHADIGGNDWIPLPLLGEGAVSLAGTILAIADTPGGIVFLDEVDAAVHHSTLKAMWTLIIRAARKFDTQIFATTHSEESLEALGASMKDEKAELDVSYQRIRRNKKGGSVAVSYAGSELLGALDQNWEVR